VAVVVVTAVLVVVLVLVLVLVVEVEAAWRHCVRKQSPCGQLVHESLYLYMWYIVGIGSLRVLHSLQHQCRMNDSCTFVEPPKGIAYHLNGTDSVFVYAPRSLRQKVRMGVAHIYTVESGVHGYFSNT